MEIAETPTEYAHLSKIATAHIYITRFPIFWTIL